MESYYNIINTMTDLIKQAQQQAKVNIMRRAGRINQKQVIYGKYTWLPVPEKNKKAIVSSLQSINDMCKPTLTKLTNPKNQAELQDRIYKYLLPLHQQFNSCVKRAPTNEGVTQCSDWFNNQLNNEVKEFTKQILKQY